MRQRFFNLWVKKESLLKAIGTGFSTDPRSIDTMEDTYGEWVIKDLSIKGDNCMSSICYKNTFENSIVINKDNSLANIKLI